MPLTDDDFTGTSKMDAEPLREHNDDMDSERDDRVILRGLPDDNIDEFIDQFYDDPASMVVAGSSRDASASVGGYWDIHALSILGYIYRDKSSI